MSIHEFKKLAPGILVVGNYPAIVQSILDFDFLSKKETPSVVAMITEGRTAQKFFYGRGEVLIPCFPHAREMPPEFKQKVNWMLNVQSGRRAFQSTKTFFEIFPNALGGVIFAENMPESQATELIRIYGKSKCILGAASVGFLIPGFLKLGAIGGVDPEQIQAGALTEGGGIAVASTSGGMTNEFIRAVVGAGRRISFALSVGGERFPITSLSDVLCLAEEDPDTQALVYFGELGGVDEYEIAELLKTKRFTKPVIAYIAGAIDDAFDEPMQFGHAKALARTKDEGAKAKRAALRAAGALVADRFPEFLKALTKLPGKSYSAPMADDVLKGRQKSILSTREVSAYEEVAVPVKKGKLTANAATFTSAILEALLGRKARSPVTTAFAETVFQALIDHGGNVSGAVNTMITARAGKDMVSSLASGLLTVGPRFGGAINDAARAWHSGVMGKKTPASFVEEISKQGGRIAGIGHKKYRVGLPDPRVKALSAFTELMPKSLHYDFARGVEKVTTGKNGSLILNIDGTIAALLLDILTECEKVSEAELKGLLDAEFFNAFFIIPRSVGFIAHFMEQKENDEGLFRLPDELLFTRKRK